MNKKYFFLVAFVALLLVFAYLVHDLSNNHSIKTLSAELSGSKTGFSMKFIEVKKP